MENVSNGEKLKRALNDFVTNTLISSNDIIKFVQEIQRYSLSSLGMEYLVKSLDTDIHNIISNNVSEGDNIVTEMYLHIILNSVDVGAVLNTFLYSHGSNDHERQAIIQNYSKTLMVAIATKMYSDVIINKLKNKDKK